MRLLRSTSLLLSRCSTYNGFQKLVRMTSSKGSPCLDDIAVENFQKYLQFATVHPNPNYRPVVDWLRSKAVELNLSCSVTEIVPDNPLLVMCWKGREPDIPTIMLNSHMDVVPVVEEKWDYPPFGATMTNDGKIVARGSQDMKCVGIQQLEAVRRLQSRGVLQPRRTVYLSFVPDEELGGHKGMRPFVEGRAPENPRAPHEVRFADLNVGLFLDEGLASPLDEYLAYYDERLPCWLTVHVRGVAGHGSTLLDHTGGEILTKFIQKIMAFRAEEKSRLEQSNGQLTLGDVTTVNLTMLGGGVQQNVLPSELNATFDVRLTPSHSLSSWKEQLNKWAEESGGRIKFQFYSTSSDTREPSPSPSKDDPYWAVLDKVCAKFKTKLVKAIFPGATDARYVRQYHTLPIPAANNVKRIPAINFSPMRCTPVLLHDHNEYLTKDEFIRGCQVYTELLAELIELES